jgi:hypothetical protein
MKQIFLIGLIILTFGRCANKVQVNDSIKLKSDKIRQALIKDGINSYFKNDSLYVIDNKGNEINRIYLDLVKWEKEAKIDFDTSYYIEQSQDSQYLFVVLKNYIDVGQLFFGLIDLNTKKWLVNSNDAKETDWGLPNVAYLGSSDNKEFHLFEGGTAGGERGFEVFNSKNESVKHGGYYTDGDKNQLKWMSGNKFYYYHERDIQDSLPQDLPKLEEGRFYAQKHYWVNGKDSLAKEYLGVYVE